MTESQVVLGINAYHGDASAALLIDGICVAAAEEERFTRVKHQAGFPAAAVRWCLESKGVTAADLGHVAISRRPSAHALRKVTHAATHARGTLGMLRSRLSNAARLFDVPKALSDALEVSPSDLQAQFHQVEHHRAHMASAYYAAPFVGDRTGRVACLSLDGMGDFVSTMWGTGGEDGLEVMGSVHYPHSLGLFYTAFTQFLGMPYYGDEYKLMGLAAYGRPSLQDEVAKIVALGNGLDFRLGLDYFRHAREGVEMMWEAGSPTIGQLWSDAMVDVFGEPRAIRSDITERDMDLAASVQSHLERIVLEQLRRLSEQTQTDALVMAGGVALNCVVNGKIRDQTPFREVWVQPASNDAGTALGAALSVWHEALGHRSPHPLEHVYLGPSSSEHDCKAALEQAGVRYERLPDSQLVERAAARIVDGSVVGWFQGAMEFGPRALGNRSIVCDPRRPDMKDILNSRIKNREFFRPFAPSVLAERAGDWFLDRYPSPYMLMAYEVQKEKQQSIPAVTHEDGTSRIHTVERTVNPRFHALISAFERLTGVPLLLNTSFNENEPICRLPEEAVDCFQRTKMDVLVLGNLIAEKPA